MDSGDKMILMSIAIVLLLLFFGLIFCKYMMDMEGMSHKPGLVKKTWTYNANLDKTYDPNTTLAVIMAANNLAATRAPLSDMAPGAGTQLRDGFVGGIEGLPYTASGANFRESYRRQLDKLMTEEDQVYYLGKGLSPLYNKGSPFNPPVNPAQPMMPTSATATRAMQTSTI